MKTRVYNFSAGPATLPETILRDAQKELLNWQGLGVSILEIGHRTDEFESLMSQAEQDLRELLHIPDHYHVLFLGGAARTQFAMIPMNLLSAHQQGGYLISGIWSSMAYQEACKISQAYCIASSEKSGFTTIPEQATWQVLADISYLYYTPNETINGVRFPFIPKVDAVPLIADMTSCFLSEPLNINDFGLIFAGAQKNISNAGLTVVIVRDDLLGQLERAIPTMLDYRTHIAHHSNYATPPGFNCYLAAKMFGWIKEQGGVSALYHHNCQKAERLYAYLDASTFYYSPVAVSARSIMNICFTLKKAELESEFLRRAVQCGLYGLKGHRTVGGIRASLYNAMSLEGVDALISFMDDFSKEYQ